jgi:hypothetical protein
MIDIPLTRGMVATIDDEDLSLVAEYSWCAVPASNGRGWYAMSSVNYGAPGARQQRTIRMHQLVVPGLQRVDHLDGNGLNNTRSNLRAATHGQNVANSQKRVGTSSQYKGVTRKKTRWGAQIVANKRRRDLGSYKTEEEAAQAYNDAAVRFFGEYARLNEIRGGV